MTNNSMLKTLLTVGISVAASVAVTLGGQQLSERVTVNNQKQEIAQTVEQLAQEKLMEYLSSEAVRNKVQNVIATSNIELTEEQRQSIINAATMELSDVFAEMTSTGLTDEQIKNLEAKIYNAVYTSLASEEKTAVITEEQKRELIATISAVIETDISQEIQQATGQLAMPGLESAINNNYNTLNSSIQNNQQSIQSVNSSVNQITSNYNSLMAEYKKTVEELKKLTTTETADKQALIDALETLQKLAESNQETALSELNKAENSIAAYNESNTTTIKNEIASSTTTIKNSYNNITQILQNALKSIEEQIDEYDNTAEYSKGDIVFDPDTNTIYVSQKDGNTGKVLSNTEYWKAVYSPYSSTTTYQNGDYVVKGDNIYQSIKDNNTGNDVTDSTYWKLVTSASEIRQMATNENSIDAEQNLQASYEALAAAMVQFATQFSSTASDYLELIAPKWSSAIQYTTGQFVVFDNGLFRAKSANRNIKPQGVSSSSQYWYATSIANEINALYSTSEIESLIEQLTVLVNSDTVSIADKTAAQNMITTLTTAQNSGSLSDIKNAVTSAKELIITIMTNMDYSSEIASLVEQLTVLANSDHVTTENKALCNAEIAALNDARATGTVTQIQSAVSHARTLIATVQNDQVASVEGNVSDKWLPNSEYKRGAFCIYNDQLYRCTAAHTSGSAFDASKWSATTIGKEIPTYQYDSSTKTLYIYTQQGQSVY